MKGQQGVKNRILYDAQIAPLRGMMSSGDATTVPFSFARLLQNFRLSGRVPQVRPGITLTKAFPDIYFGTGTFLGASPVKLNGTNYIAVGYHHTSNARLYAVGNLEGAATYTEITGASNRLGNTTNEVVFAVTVDPDTGKELLVCQNGSKYPRVWNPYASTLAIHAPVKPPIVSTVLYGGFNTFGQTWYVAASPHVFTNSAARMTASDQPGAGVCNYMQLVVNANVNQGDNSIFDFGANTNFAGMTGLIGQLHFWLEGQPEVWDQLKIEVDQAGTGAWTIMHDPTTQGAHSSVIVPESSGSDRYILACSMAPLQSDAANWSTATRFRVTWVAATLGGGAVALYTVKFWAVYFTGNVPGESAYRLTLYNPNSKAESKPAAPASRQMGHIASQGGLDTLNARQPFSPDLTYAVIGIQGSVYADDVTAGATKLVVYRKDPGDADYYFARDETLTPGAGVMRAFNTTDNFAPASKKTDRVAPSNSNYTPMPIARAIASIGHRLWLGDIIDGPQSAVIASITKGSTTLLTLDDRLGYLVGQKIEITGAAGGAGITGLNGVWTITEVSQTTANVVRIDCNSSGFAGAYTGNSGSASGQRKRGDVWFSYFKDPLKFSSVARVVNGRIDGNSASKFQIPGHQVMSFSGISIQGIDHTMIWTDQFLFFTGGTLVQELERLQVMGPHGTLAPRSIARHGLDVYWLDQLNQVRSLNGGNMRSLSRQVVDDTLYACPDTSKCWGAFFNDRLHMAYRTSASLNGGTLVFDERVYERHGPLSAWTQDAFAGSTVAQAIVTLVVSGQERMYYVANTGAIFQAESGTTDNGTVPTSKWWTSEYEAEGGIFNMSEWGRVGIIADKAASTAKITVTKSGKIASTETRVGEIELATVSTLQPTNDSIYLWEMNTAAGESTVPPKIEANSCMVKLEGPIPCGTRIYSVVMEEEPRTIQAETSGG